MRHSRVVLSMCGFLATCSMVGYSAPPQVKEEVPSVQSELMIKKLLVIIQNYQSDSTAPLSSQDISDLSDYAANSLETGYDNLNYANRSMLSQIINLNSDLFSKSHVAKFNNDQKLFARMSTKDIDALRAIVIDIRDGKALTERQVSDVKDFKTMISHDPYAFIPELLILSQYVTLNSDVFNSSDMDTFRQASRSASGITATEMSSLNEIAGRDNVVLNLEDVKVLKSLGNKAPIGSLNGLDPSVVISIYKIINDNNKSFPPEVVSRFNNAFNNNQAIQRYITKSDSEGKKLQSAPKSRHEAPSSAAQR